MLSSFPRFALTVALGTLLVGCGSDENPENVKPVAFQASADTRGERILDLGGLTLTGSCERDPGGQGRLVVTAATSLDNAVLGSRFSQGGTPYTFVLSDFDRSYGQYDLLGNASGKIAGELNYSRPDGGQVSVSYLADEDTAQGDCTFDGVATYAP